MDSTTTSLEEALASFDEPDPAPTMAPPPDVWVTLPGGYRSPDDKLCTRAVVREMTGAAEEQVSRIQASLRKKNISYHGAVSEILGVMVEKIEGVPMDNFDFGNLLLGDRLTLLVAARIASYGSELDLDVKCPHCQRELEITLDLEKDVETKEAPTTAFEVPLSDGRTARVGFVTGHAADRATEFTGDDATMAEINTYLLAETLYDIDGTPPVDLHPDGGLGVARAMKSRDRHKILKKIHENQPGPRLGEVSVDCVACRKEIPLPLDALDLMFL